MTSNYVRGRYFEYEVERLLRKKGWTVFRSAASRGIDLIAFRCCTRVLWISCKYGKRAAVSDRSWIDAADKAGIIYVEARKLPGEKIKWKRLTRKL
jgi:Holliday junction resolvase